MTYYAAINLNDRSARTGNSRRRVLAFATRYERDQFVADYPTYDCEAVRAKDVRQREKDCVWGTDVDYGTLARHLTPDED